MKLKFSIMACACLLSSMVLYAQTTHALVSNAAVHVLYRGEKNPIQVSVPGVGNSAISVECADAKVVKDQSGVTWLVTPKDSIQSVVLKIYKNANNTKVLVKEQRFAVLDASLTAFLYMGGVEINSNRAHRKSLNQQTELVVDFPYESMRSTQINITEFTACIYSHDYLCVGNKFSVEALKAIATLKSKDVLQIHSIKATDANGKSLNVKPCKIIIK